CFGASTGTVRRYLGMPEEQNEDFSSATPSVHWSYPSIGIDAYFSAEDGFVLGTLRTASRDASLLGEKLIGRRESHVRSWLGRNLGESNEELLEFSDHPSMFRMSYPGRSIEFWFEFEKLDSIIWSYLIDGNDQTIWPASPGLSG